MEEIRLQGLYLKDILEKGIRDIYAAQKAVATEKIDMSSRAKKSRSGELLRALTSPDYKISAQGAGVYAVMNYPREIRFQDIRHLGNWRVYNKPLWQTLFKETFVNMRYEFTDWLSERIRKSLEQAIQPLNNQS